MAQINLLEINPDKLFQTYSIADIAKVQKQIQYEIDRKREDLRAMVGERYRELIHAADTIEEMKETSTSTYNHIEEIISTCKNLNETHLAGFKIEKEPKVSTHGLLPTDSIQSLSVQIKLLMEIPEKIWTAIEQEDFIKATQLFVLARHIHTGLQLQLGSKTPKPGMEFLHRLVYQQWTSIANFSQTIISVCNEKMQNVNNSVEMACSCLISLYIIDCQSMSELLHSLIDLQSNNSLRATLNFELSKILDGDIKTRIKEKIVNGVKIVLRTVELVYSCFVENNGGAVLSKLLSLYSKDSKPLMELVQFKEPDALKLLPPVILNYRLTTSKEIKQLDKSEISQYVLKWSESVKLFIEESLTSLLQNINRVKMLHEIREEAFKVDIPQNWSSICSSLSIPEVHVWCHYFQPILTRRVKLIIDNRWAKLYDIFKTQLLVDLTKVSQDTDIEKEADVNWFVWKDLIGETVIETRGDVIKVMESLMKGMWLQDRGYTPTLEKLCQMLDTELQKLLEDLKFYLYSNKSRQNKDKLLYVYEDEADSEQIYSDRKEVEEHLRMVTEEYVQSILNYIKACFEEPTLQNTEIQKKTTAIYTARFLQSITDLITSLHKCYIGDGVYTSDQNVVKQWEGLCKVLNENCLYCWGKWVDIAIAKVEELTTDLPQEFTLEANVDFLMMQWDVIKIEEKDDEGKAIESLIKVPYGPSLKLQQFLHFASRIIDEVVPHTLPTEIHKDFIQKLSSITLAHYNKVIREKETDINQRCALQLLMDVRHLTLLLVPRENKKNMDFSQEICEFLRQKIDPFDYDVFYPHIQTNLKRSVQRVQTLFGSLILNHVQLTSIIGNKLPPSSGGTANPALLAASSSETKHWFSLLPVAAPLARKNVEQQQKKKPVLSSPSKPTKSEISELMSNSIPINFANARSNAASFFTSMTSDWFSGS